jgi:glycerol-3-phosphate dehydrogenase
VRRTATGDLPIIGAAAPADLDALASRLTSTGGVDAEAARSLVDRHGTEASDVLELGRDRDMVRLLVPGFPYLEAEVAWAVEHELAMSVDDMLTRRIRLAPEVRDRGASCATRIAQIMGAILGWDQARRAAEVATYVEGAHREFDVPAPG